MERKENYYTKGRLSQKPAQEYTQSEQFSRELYPSEISRNEKGKEGKEKKK